MLPVLIGLVSATLFGLIAQGMYGTEALYAYPWVDLVFWTLIVTGATISAIDSLSSCLVCRLSRRLGWAKQVQSFCSAAPCR